MNFNLQSLKINHKNQNYKRKTKIKDLEKDRDKDREKDSDKDRNRGKGRDKGRDKGMVYPIFHNKNNLQISETQLKIAAMEE